MPCAHYHPFHPHQLAETKVPEISIKYPVPSNVQAEQYVPSTKIARNELGLLQWIDLETAIDKTKQWYLETAQ